MKPSRHNSISLHILSMIQDADISALTCIRHKFKCFHTKSSDNQDKRNQDKRGTCYVKPFQF